jgi:intein/homing endonuclease
VVLGGITYEAIGIVPEYKDDGYIITSYNKIDYVDILRFQISKLVDYDKFYIVNVEFSERLSNVSMLFRAPEFLKAYLLDRYWDMPNPLVLYITLDYYVPLHETLIPIIKRVLPVWIQRT